MKHVLVGRVNGIELRLGPLGLVAGFRQRRLRQPDGRAVVALARRQCRQRRFDTQRLQRIHCRRAHRCIDAYRAETDAVCPFPVFQTQTPIDNRLAAVTDLDPTVAMAAAQQTRKKLRTVAHRAADLGHVLRKQLLIPLEVVPGDVAIVVVTKQHRPVLRVLFGNPSTHAFAALVEHSFLATPAIGIGASDIRWRVSGRPDGVRANRPVRRGRYRAPLPSLPRDSVVGQCRGRVEMTGCETWRTRDGHLPACAGRRRPAAGVRVSERPGCRRSWAGRGGACGRSTTVGSLGRGSHLGRHARPHGRWVARKGRRAGQLPVRTTGRIHAGESAVDRIELPEA